VYLNQKPSSFSSHMDQVPPMHMEVEAFDNEAPADQTQVSSGLYGSYQGSQGVSASESITVVEQPQSVMQTGSGLDMNQLPSECYPKNVLSPADLLPGDANSPYAQYNPASQGSLADQNFLTAGFHIGINTVGQTLRNANRQLRSEPLNPQVKVSPWMQTTIEPDINRKPLEIGGGDL
jgi:hypothetical protein